MSDDVVGFGGGDEPAVRPGPPKPCMRCSVPVEMPGDALLARGGEVVHGAICGHCQILSLADQRKFWDGFPKPPVVPDPEYYEPRKWCRHRVLCPGSHVSGPTLRCDDCGRGWRQWGAPMWVRLAIWLGLSVVRQRRPDDRIN